MAASFTGLLNLRGQMVGVVDLRIRFQLGVPANKPGIILVVDLGESLLGAHVDDVLAVVNVPPSEVHTNFTVGTRVSVDFLTGIATVGGRMVSIIELSKLLSTQELRTFHESMRA
jgi:purine-binding chemotaxis protein CheW